MFNSEPLKRALSKGYTVKIVFSPFGDISDPFYQTCSTLTVRTKNGNEYGRGIKHEETVDINSTLPILLNQLKNTLDLLEKNKFVDEAPILVNS